MKKNYFLSVLFLTATLSSAIAADYTVTFRGTGASETVESVQVKNITTGATVTVPAGNTLLLSDDPTGINQISRSGGDMYVLSSDGIARLTFFPERAGQAQINVFGLDGRKVTGSVQQVYDGKNSVDLLLPKGSYIINVSGNGYSYSTKYIERSNFLVAPSVSYAQPIEQAIAEPEMEVAVPTRAGVTAMLYNDGDQLLYTGRSGNYATVVSNSPMSDEVIEFYFVACTDGSGNHYKVVQIGLQVWMAENLRTTKYNDGTDMPLGEAATWNTLRTPAYIPVEDHYFYNWFAASNEKTAPAGSWRVATRDDYDMLSEMVEMQINVDKETVASALAAEYGWTYKATDNLYTAGDNLKKNNTTGFTAYPTGYFNGTMVMDDTSLAIYWTADPFDENENEGLNARIFNDYPLLNRASAVKVEGVGIRCVMDLE